MIPIRLRQASLLLFAMLISVVAFYQMFLRVYGHFPANYIGLLAVVGALFLVLWGLLLRFKPYASQAILPCVLMLTAIGVVMIARIDKSGNSSVGSRQLIWLCIALTLCGILVAVMRDYRVLRKYSYVNMVIGLILLLSPMIPGLGRNINGAKIWIRIGGYSLQPAEFAKLFLAFFFAAYLFDHRDQLAVGGKKVLGLQLPRIKDLGPIIMVWLISMGVLIMQRDLGTSLMFFAMFVAMLYAATGRRSWIVIGFIAFAVGAVAAASVFSHVGQRVDSWLHPFSDEQYNRIGGSWQLVTGIFGMASGGMTGTGLGHGQPGLTTFANSDFIYSSVGEELGLTGLMAVLVLYLLIIASGFITAMKIKDGFGKLLASGLVFTMAFQVFTVVGGITLVIPLTGMTMPYMAAGGSSLIANYLLAALLMIISNAANRPEPDTLSDTFQYEALAVLRDRELKERTDKESAPEREPQAERPPEPATRRRTTRPRKSSRQVRDEQIPQAAVHRRHRLVRGTRHVHHDHHRHPRQLAELRPAQRKGTVSGIRRSRGAILASDGTILAQSTPVNDVFSYQRSYTNGPVYAPVTGFFSVTQRGDRGIESSRNKLLSGKADALFWDQLKSLFTGVENKGASIETSINPKLQQLAYQQLGSNDGAAVVIEVKTYRIPTPGERPSYDPNALATHDTKKATANYSKLAAQANSPMINRATSQLYPPGSTFKTIVAATALESGDYDTDTQIPAGAKLYAARNLDEPDQHHHRGERHRRQDHAAGRADILVQHRVRPARRETRPGQDRRAGEEARLRKLDHHRRHLVVRAPDEVRRRQVPRHAVRRQGGAGVHRPGRRAVHAIAERDGRRGHRERRQAHEADAGGPRAGQRPEYAVRSHARSDVHRVQLQHGVQAQPDDAVGGRA